MARFILFPKAFTVTSTNGALHRKIRANCQFNSIAKASINSALSGSRSALPSIIFMA